MTSEEVHGNLDGCRRHIERGEPYCDLCATSWRVTKNKGIPVVARRGSRIPARLQIEMPPSPRQAAQLARDRAEELEDRARVSGEVA